MSSIYIAIGEGLYAKDEYEWGEGLLPEIRGNVGTTSKAGNKAVD
ncbi:MAG TPA: hypothetical protein VEO19_13485 [Terriglobia bacterium]|nr:hypothetical protein [Terriglobia bacterium]